MSCFKLRVPCVRLRKPWTKMLCKEQPFPFTGSKKFQFFPYWCTPFYVSGFRKRVGIMSIYMATASLLLSVLGRIID